VCGPSAYEPTRVSVSTCLAVNDFDAIFPTSLPPNIVWILLEPTGTWWRKSQIKSIFFIDKMGFAGCYWVWMRKTPAPPEKQKSAFGRFFHGHLCTLVGGSH
jgi:hypothetical protein